MAREQTLSDVARQAVSLARGKGAQAAAALAYREREVSVEWRDGKLQKIQEATTRGVALQLFVIDIAGEDEPSDLRVFINPEILERHETIVWNEGCLSFPGVAEEIERAARVRVRALDRNGKPFELEAEGLLAVAIQHEYDHLQGTLMIDHMGPLKKRIVQRKMQKRSAEAGDTAE